MEEKSKNVEKLISVIVPVYNVEQYLSECIDSIIDQTYQNIEIILVDDGSTDGCPQLCDEYKEKDSRIKVIHKKNGGLSSARNSGMKIANGNYITFIDSDDIVMNDYVDFLYTNLENNNVDISCCGCYNYYENGKKVNTKVQNVEKKYDRDTALKFMNISGFFDCGAWSKLYKKEVFQNIVFPEGKKSEDLFIMAKTIYNSNNLYYSSTPHYLYRQRKDSITKSRNINYDVLDATRENFNFIKEKEIYDAIPYAKRRLIIDSIGVYNAVLTRKNDKEKLKEIRKMILEQNNSIPIDYMPKLKRIQLNLFFHSAGIYNIFFKVYSLISNGGLR